MATLTSAELAKTLGMTPARVSQLGRDGMPRAGRNQWNLAACERWLESRNANKGESRDSLTREKIRQTRLQGDKIELGIAEQARLLIPREDVEFALDAAAVAIRANLDTWANDGSGATERTQRQRIADATLLAVGASFEAAMGGTAVQDLPEPAEVPVSRSMG